jgi:formate dehydrogenase subunit gamma
MSASTKLLAASLLAAVLALPGIAAAQAVQPGQSQGSQASGAAPARVIDDPAPGQAAPGGIQGQNIFDVKPEVKRDASSEPGYDKQNNAQRNAVQPGNNSPMWRDVQRGVEGYTSLPKSQAPEAGVLIQPQVQYPGSRLTTAGEAWRQVRNNWIIPYGGALVLITLGAMLIFFFTKGPLGRAQNDGAPRIERFTPFERSAHWFNAIAFTLLMISGLVMAFGRYFLLPIIGPQLFGWLSYALKNVHNFAGPVFAVSLVVILVAFLRDNLPQRGDLRWFTSLGKEPSNRFNPVQKLLYWGATLVVGLVVVVSGLYLDKLIPNMAYLRGDMQVAHMVHAVAAILMTCAFLGHIYIGTVGMRGAYKAMRTGYVDDEWAREHHGRWYEDVQAGRIPAQRSQPPASTPSAEQARPA